MTETPRAWWEEERGSDAMMHPAKLWLVKRIAGLIEDMKLRIRSDG